MGILETLFGGKGEIDWKELERLMTMESDLNRTDRIGPFTGWGWDRDEQGNPVGSQRMLINPNFQGAVDRLGDNAGGPQQSYQMPPGAENMMSGLMNRMGMNIPKPPGYDDQGDSGYGDY